MADKDEPRNPRWPLGMEASIETLLGVLCLVVGSSVTAVNVLESDAAGVMLGFGLLGLAVFWFSGGLTGHGSL